MANRIVPGIGSKTVARRHGKRGNVVLQADISPELKDRLIARSTREGTTMVAQVRAALEEWTA